VKKWSSGTFRRKTQDKEDQEGRWLYILKPVVSRTGASNSFVDYEGSGLDLMRLMRLVFYGFGRCFYLKCVALHLRYIFFISSCIALRILLLLASSSTV